MNRFRPNLVVSGCNPFDEDNWKQIKIGSIFFHVVKPCSRCMMMTTDQETATRYKEPLRTLTRYRKFNGIIFFR